MKRSRKKHNAVIKAKGGGGGGRGDRTIAELASEFGGCWDGVASVFEGGGGARMLERGVSKSVVLLTGDRGFESVSLQQRVSLSPASAFEGREPRLSARVCAAGSATRSAETRRAFHFAPIGGNISVGPHSSTAAPPMGSAIIRTKSGLAGA